MFFRDLWHHVGSSLRHWKLIVRGEAVGLLGAAANVRPFDMPRLWWLAIGFIGVPVAQFLAWRSTHQELEHLQETLGILQDTVRFRLSFQQPLLDVVPSSTDTTKHRITVSIVLMNKAPIMVVLQPERIVVQVGDARVVANKFSGDGLIYVAPGDAITITADPILAVLLPVPFVCNVDFAIVYGSPDFEERYRTARVLEITTDTPVAGTTAQYRILRSVEEEVTPAPQSTPSKVGSLTP